MAYIVGQYNHNNNFDDGEDYIDILTNGTAKKRESKMDSGVSGDVPLEFEDECVQVGDGLLSSNYYYFKGMIQRMDSDQTFYIKLVNFDSDSTEDLEQYIKTITVGTKDLQGVDPENKDELILKDWVSVEFIFNPIINFDTILFQLQRTTDDYRVAARVPKIAYQELGIVKNIIPSKVKPNVPLLKMGVQSHPGFCMCINGEEMHVPRSGIFEIRDGILPINFFSAVSAATELSDGMENWEYYISEQTLAGEDMSQVPSECFFDTEKETKINSFTLDYIYNEE